MRGSGDAPAATASRSDHPPAHTTAARPRVAPRAWVRLIDLPAVEIAPTAHPVETVAPARARSEASERATSPKSTTPVAGECRAEIPAAWGSISRSTSASIRRSPGTPLAAARRSSSSRPGSSDSSVATITLPDRSARIPRRSQYSYIALAPATHSSAFSDPGR
jgi:hypothetical protein